MRRWSLRMASSFRIPKKTQPTDSDSAHIQSPLSRLQSPAPQFKSYGGQWSRKHDGNTAGRVGHAPRAPCRLTFTNVVKTLLGLGSPKQGGASSANHRSPGSCRSQSEGADVSNSRWRPKRASDRLLEPPPPPQKRKSVCVDSVDSLSLLRTGEGHGGSPSSSTRSTIQTGSPPDSPVKKQQKKNHPSEAPPPSSSLKKSLPIGRRSLGPSSSSSSSSSSLFPDCGDVRERARERWREFTEEKKKKTTSMSVVLRLRPKKPKAVNHSEPIVLSSDEDADGGDEGQTTSLRNQTDQSGVRSQVSPPSFLQLDFTSLHVGLTAVDANGAMTISESGIMIPVKGSDEGEVTVVASQVRGYGVWDGGVVRGGILLAGWEGPAPSLLFLWVTDAQANLLQRELMALHTSSSGPPCSFLILMLKEQLQELQAALLSSILELDEYKRSSSPEGPASPLDWTDGLLLLYGCPPPVDQHLLRLLGHSTTSCQLRTSSRTRTRTSLIPAGLQQLPTRLIQYPVAPHKGRITVSKEDLICLEPGEFLNDVIIDFYLKYLLLEGVGGPVAQQSHVFSSFFYKQLSRRRTAGEDPAPSVPDRHMRHQRVKTWTRHVDIFSKDFLFVPVNQEAHWFLVMVCFPGLEDVRHQSFQTLSGGSKTSTQKTTFSLRSQQPPECSEQGWRKETVLQRPCILVMDSLKLSYHDHVCRLIRDYLQVEWDVRRKSPRLFSVDTMRSSSCRVPQQDNSSDCGLYLLQYVHAFLQNPVVNFDLPLRLDNWFPRQQVHQKREEIRSVILKLHQSQQKENGTS
ncbi:sentrin-specific protease 7-like isoform 3-T3 [Pholidichthys leucotaenia]